jgi:hypothetical protein
MNLNFLDNRNQQLSSAIIRVFEKSHDGFGSEFDRIAGRIGWRQINFTFW